MKRTSAIVFVTSLAAASASAQPALPSFETRYYVIHSPLDPDTLREAAVRVDRMAETYYDRTRGFAGEIRRKMPLYLFEELDDYHAAGGRPGSAGVFDGRRLMAVLGAGPHRDRWSTVQHEGFHQFAHAVITGDIPMWVNEGLAVYFEHGIFTGDGYVTGVIPADRLQRVRTLIEQKAMKTVPQMMLISMQEWNAELSFVNYDQAWSMVHFLAHAEGGKYQKAFDAFLRSIGGGDPWEDAWLRGFGRGTEEFQQQWSAYWMGQPDDPTADLRDRATVETLTSFLARAVAKRQRFDSVEAFFGAANAGTLECSPDDWLPPSLLEEAMDRRGDARWSLTGRGNRVQLVCELSDRTKLIGSFKLRGARVGGVTVRQDD
jgi:hypothetical protein